MSILKNIEKFNTHSMSDETILSVVTGRHLLIQNLSTIIQENIKQPDTTQHVVLIGPRGMGKSFLLRYFQIITKKQNIAEGFVDFALLPEEQHNINGASEFIDELLARAGFNDAASKSSLWDANHENWTNSVNKLQILIEKKKLEYGNYLFIAAVENLDVLLESVFKSKVDESRFRKLLSGTPNFMLFGTSLKSDIDSEYNKRLFHAFQKFPIEPWNEDDYMNYFQKRFELLKRQNPDEYNQKDIGLLTNKLKSISKFTGGSPRMAVVLTNLIFNDDAVSTAQTLNDIVEDLSPYYQDMMLKMPAKSRLLFDALIREKENISQSELAEKVGTQQATISQAFKWLVDNNYISGHRISGEKKYRYSVADRVFVLFYYKRYIHNGLQCSYIRILSDFILSFYNTHELSQNTLKYLQGNKKPEGIEFAKMVFQKTGRLDKNINWDNYNEVEIEIKKVIYNEEINNLFSVAEDKINEQDYSKALQLHKEALNISKIENDLSKQLTSIEKIGLDFKKLKEYEKAIEYHQKAYELWKQEGDISRQVINLEQIGWNYKELKNFEKAIEYYQNAYELSKQEGNVRIQALILEPIGWSYNELKNFEKAIEYYQNAYELWKQEGDVSMQALNLGQIGWSYNELKEFEKAIGYHQQAYELSKHEGDESEQAWNLSLIGLNYNELKEFEKAIGYHQQAYELSKQEGDISDQAWNLEQIGLNYKELKDFEKAIAYHQQAYELSKQDENLSGQAWNLGQIGWNYKELKDFEKAIAYHQQSYELWKQEGDVSGQALNLEQIGLNYNELKDFEKAIASLHQTYELSKQEGAISGQARSLGLIGWSYNELKDFEKAIAYHQQSYELWKQEGDVKMQVLNLEQIGLSYKEIKDFEKAIASLHQAYELSRQEGDKSWQARYLGQIGVNHLLNNSDNAWILLEDEKYYGIPKEQIFKEFGDAVFYTEKWKGKAPAFKIANEILIALKTRGWKLNKYKAFSNFFADLLNIELSFELLRDICNEAKGMFENEGDVIIEAVQHYISYIESGKDDNYLLKLNPDMANAVKEIILEAEL